MTISNEAAAGMETVELEPLREDKKRIFKDILGISKPIREAISKFQLAGARLFLQNT